jgi:hypothetical protein
MNGVSYQVRLSCHARLNQMCLCSRSQLFLCTAFRIELAIYFGIFGLCHRELHAFHVRFRFVVSGLGNGAAWFGNTFIGIFILGALFGPSRDVVISRLWR